MRLSLLKSMGMQTRLTDMLVTHHQRKDFCNSRVGLLKPPSKLFVQEEARKLCCTGALQKLNKNLPGLARDVVSCGFERIIAHKMRLIVICSELPQAGLNLSHVDMRVELEIEQPLHLVEVGSVKPWGQYSVC